MDAYHTATCLLWPAGTFLFMASFAVMLTVWAIWFQPETHHVSRYAMRCDAATHTALSMQYLPERVVIHQMFETIKRHMSLIPACLCRCPSRGCGPSLPRTPSGRVSSRPVSNQPGHKAAHRPGRTRASYTKSPHPASGSPCGL